MKVANIIATLIGITAAFGILASADAQTVNQRLQNQHARIHQGLKTGQLTHREARSVRRADRRIHRSERWDRAMHNGHLTAGERMRLQGRLNRNSARIYRKKHNGVVQP